MEQIAVYGGAFNPPTLAHEQVIRTVLETTDITHVIISPSGEREDKTSRIPLEARRRLIDIFIEILREQGLSVSLDSYFFEGKNGTVTTTRAEEAYFRRKLGKSPYFIFGSDTAPNMSWWSDNDGRYIQEQLKKIFIKRPGYEYDFKANGFREYMLLDILDMLEISSSLAREMVEQKGVLDGILHSRVQKEIEENILYTL